MNRAIFVSLWLLVAIAFVVAQSQKAQPQKKTESFWAQVLRTLGVSTGNA